MTTSEELGLPTQEELYGKEITEESHPEVWAELEPSREDLERRIESISIERPTCKECGGYVVIGEYCLEHTAPELLERLRR